MDAQLPPIPPSIAEIAGPPLVGIMLNCFFYGILVMQIYVYFQCFPDDREKIKVLDGVIAFVTQTFFCWRISVLQKSWWLPGTVFLVSLGAIASGVGTFQLHDLSRIHVLTWQLCLRLAPAALADTMIARYNSTVSFDYFGRKRTESVVSRAWVLMGCSCDVDVPTVFRHVLWSDDGDSGRGSSGGRSERLTLLAITRAASYKTVVLRDNLAPFQPLQPRRFL
ncbi:hypothetical protein LshimejAT787_0606480 [Lyophyllum shimeji]|uniref:Uncharacterized protein n=1 Tax=Lyophyllum shimeji TaxID=47721 RepID=A0A9P3PPN9_LYOSH|nr:hypothetical protein LshimejAT787_0606480 [Lyophyllum shimeji]